MKGALRYLGALVAGSTVGGLFVGWCEALYRGAPLTYGALLYGSLWALAAAPLCSPVLILPSRYRPAPGTLGLSVALGLSALALVRFIVFRDLFAEAPDRATMATGVAIAAAALLCIFAWRTGRWASRRLVMDGWLSGWWLWLVPLVALLSFGTMAQGDGGVDLDPSDQAVRKLSGEGVILVVVDALRADALGVYGAPLHRGTKASPHVDEFARKALIFRDVSAQASWTRPAVASLLTSRHVSAHTTMSKSAVLPEGLPTLASVAKEAGAKTAAVVTNYNLEPSYGFGRGFDDFRYLAPARYLGAPEGASRLAAYNTYRLIVERFAPGKREARYFYRPATSVNANAFAILNQIGDGRFFLYLHYMEPHDPYFSIAGKSFARVANPRPPLSWAEPMRDAYRDEVHRFDTAFGQLLAGLSARGLDGRVTVMLTSDHGEEFGEHGGFYHGLTLYEEMLHLPLIVAGPGLTPGSVGTLARQIDLAPTLAARLGASAPPSWEGRDLLGSTSVPITTVAEEDHEGNVLASVREGAKKLILANDNNPRGLPAAALFDLITDPRELTPVSEPQAQETVGSLRQRLGTALAEAKKGGAQAVHRQLDSQSEAELRSLGYMH